MHAHLLTLHACPHLPLMAAPSLQVAQGTQQLACALKSGRELADEHKLGRLRACFSYIDMLRKVYTTSYDVG